MHDDPGGRRLLSVAETTARLGIKPATLYAYVSRGLLSRRRRPGERGSWFDPSEVERLSTRGRGAAPVRPEVRIESAVTAIEGGTYFYRGQDPVRLARTTAFERVAELLWTGELPADAVWEADAAAVARARAAQRVLPADALAFDRVRLATAALAGTDPFRHDLRPAAVVVTARRLLTSLVEALPAAASEPRAGTPRFAARVWTRLRRRRPSVAEEALVNGALVLLADHELAASTLAARIAAAFRADPYDAVGAGLGVLGGAWHGAVSLAAEALLREIADARSVAATVERRLRLGERLPGLGQPLYPAGDPRVSPLLDLLRAAAPRAPRLRHVEQYVLVARDRGLPPPNVDLALAAVTHVLELPRGTGELLFALARMAGWIAHAIEEYERPSALRPRAVYVGVRPAPPG